MVKKKKNVVEESRSDILKRVMGELNKSFKKDVISFGSEHKSKERIPTGIEPFDKFIGGGIVKGNFAIFYGSESCGKSTLAYSLIANAQKEGKVCALIDMEHNFQEDRVAQLGIDTSKLILIENCETAEEAMDILRKLCQEKVIDLGIVDSIQALAPKGSMYTKTGKEKSIEDDEMALLARKMSKFLTTTAGFVHNGEVAIVLIGQTRVGGLGSFVTREVCTGGKAKDFWSVLTVRMRRGAKSDAPTEAQKVYFTDENGKERYKTEHNIIGFESVLKIEKHKITGCSPEGSELRLPFYYESGYMDSTDTNEQEIE